ncbi:MAG: hypothetical protein ACYTFT_09830 [Planctomycetota bacterium]|jgi:hypothetical protein
MANLQQSPLLEGTFTLDGLVEFPWPEQPEERARLEASVKEAQRRGVALRPAVDGGTVSLLANGAPIAARSLGTHPQSTVEKALRSVLEALPAELHGRVDSTLRSTEVQPGQQIQTIYAIGRDGSVDARDRIVVSDTRAPRGEDPRRWWALGGVMLVITAVLALFLFRTDAGRDIRFGLTGAKGLTVTVEALPEVGDFVTIQVQPTQARGVPIHIARGPRYPEAEKLHAPQDWADATPRQALTRQALATGYLRVETFDAKGRFVRTFELRVRGLEESEHIDTLLPIRSPADRTFRITY